MATPFRVGDRVRVAGSSSAVATVLHIVAARFPVAHLQYANGDTGIEPVGLLSRVRGTCRTCGAPTNIIDGERATADGVRLLARFEACTACEHCETITT